MAAFKGGNGGSRCGADGCRRKAWIGGYCPTHLRGEGLGRKGESVVLWFDWIACAVCGRLHHPKATACGNYCQTKEAR